MTISTPETPKSLLRASVTHKITLPPASTLEHLYRLTHFFGYQPLTPKPGKPLSFSTGDRFSFNPTTIHHRLTSTAQGGEIVEIKLETLTLPWLKARYELILAKRLSDIVFYLDNTQILIADKARTTPLIKLLTEKILRTMLSVTGGVFMTVLLLWLYGFFVLAVAEKARSLLEVFVNTLPGSAFIIGTVIAWPLGLIMAIFLAVGEHVRLFSRYVPRLFLVFVLLLLPLMVLEDFLISTTILTLLIPLVVYLGYSLAQTLVLEAESDE